jgi:transposase-like protein
MKMKTSFKCKPCKRKFHKLTKKNPIQMEMKTPYKWKWKVKMENPLLGQM